MKKSLFRLIIISSMFVLIFQTVPSYAKQIKELATPVVNVQINEHNVPVVSWDTVKNATKYSLYRKVGVNGKWEEIESIKETKYTDSDLIADEGTIVTYKVQAHYYKLGYDPVASKYSEEQEIELLSNTGYLKLNKDNFPDKYFRQYLMRFDTNKDKILSAYEIDNIYTIDLRYVYYNNKIKSLSGIEFFYNLEILMCDDCSISKLDLSKNTKLETLWCSGNKIKKLDLSANTQLSLFSANGNPLTELTGLNPKKIESIWIANTKIKTIDFSNYSALYNFGCDNCSELKSINLSNCKKLHGLSCKNCNNLSSINVSKCVSLDEINCNDCILNSITLTGCKKLESLYCNNNKLQSINLSGLSELKRIELNNNKLQSIDLSGLSKLRRIELNNNKLSSLEVSKLSSLEELSCNDNKIKKLDVSQNKALYYVYCRNNGMSNLVLPSNGCCLSCTGNSISTLDLTNVRNSLIECDSTTKIKPNPNYKNTVYYK